MVTRVWFQRGRSESVSKRKLNQLYGSARAKHLDRGKEVLEETVESTCCWRNGNVIHLVSRRRR